MPRTPPVLVVIYLFEALAGLATANAQSAGSAGTASVPVRIGQGAQFGAKNGLEAALRESTDVWDVRVGKTRQRVQLRNCIDYLAVARQQIETEDPGDQRALIYLEARCEALKLLREARPSARSFLDGFRLDAGAPDLLPADLYLDLSPEDTRKIRAAAHAGRSWRSFDSRVRVTNADRGALAVKGNGYEAELVEYARGDFDRDGIEDILILRTASPIGASMTDYTVFLLSRASTTTPLKVLKTWRQAY